MVPDKPQKVEIFHFTWCGYIGFRARYYVKVLSKSMGDSGRNLREIWEKAGKSVQNPRKILAKSAKNTWKIREKSVKNPRKIKLGCACHFRFHSFRLFLAMAGWQSSFYIWSSHGLNFPFHLEIAIDVISLYRSLSGGKCPCRGSWVHDIYKELIY